MYKDKYTKELAKHGDVSLVMYVSEDDHGEHTQYVVCRWYDSTQPIGQQWYSGDYYGEDKLLEATEAFKERSGYKAKGEVIPRPRLEELVTCFKDILVDYLDMTYVDFSEDGNGDYDLDLTDEELEWLGIEEFPEIEIDDDILMDED